MDSLRLLSRDVSKETTMNVLPAIDPPQQPADGQAYYRSSSTKRLPSGQPVSPLSSLWQWWITLTGPPANAFERSISSQERLRRARLTSALLLLACLALGFLIP